MAWETKVFTTIGILGFIGAALSLSPNLTGNIIGEMSSESTNFLGLIFLAIGIASIGVARIRD